jgi:oligopeptidase B
MPVQSQLHPPLAERKPHPITVNGHTRIDDYFWLREKTSQEVLDYLHAENSYTEAMMAHTNDLQKTLYKEMVGRIQETDEEVPVQYGPYLYYTRTVEGQQYPIHCRKPIQENSPEQVLLDLNVMVAENKWAYAKLGVYEVSPDHNLLAYSLDLAGDENFILQFKDLVSGQTLPDQIPLTKYDGEWANDNRTFFYVTQDHAKRDSALHRHELGTPVSDDVLVYEEHDERFWVGLYKTRDDAFLALAINSLTTSEVWVLDANYPQGDLRLTQERTSGLEYTIDHHEGLFYIVTNHDAVNFKLATAPVATPSLEHWVDLIPHDPAVLIQGVDLFENHLVLYKRERGLKTLSINDLRTQQMHELEFPESAYTYYSHSNPEYQTNLLRVTYTSQTTPNSIYDINMDTFEWELKKRKPVLGGYDPQDYVTERILATAPDGVEVPLSIVYKKGFKADGSAPCLLYGYGSYGYSIDPAFNSDILSLLDRGFVYAIAHIRGGQEMGRPWYQDGKWLNKRNTFTDFIACGKYLIERGYTSASRLAIEGHSAGGLLVGAVLNLAPDLCQAAIVGVPFVDVVTTMLDESIPLTINEFEEWGDPKQPEYYEYMLSYSPYDNLEPRMYPHCLVTAGLNDPRVQYWEPAKWVAKARMLFEGDNRLILKTNMEAGHHGKTGRYDLLKEIAFNYAFVIDALSVNS